jgi:hypothetical protein
VFGRDEDTESVRTCSDGDQALLKHPHEASGDLALYMKENRETPATEGHMLTTVSQDYGQTDYIKSFDLNGQQKVAQKASKQQNYNTSSGTAQINLDMYQKGHSNSAESESTKNC